MANPNPEIYGSPETWQTCKYFPWTGTSNPDIKLTKPKIPNFNGQGNGSLGAGDTAGKTILNIPIDKTLCPCGQDNTVSCLGDISIFQNTKSVDGNKTPSIITPESRVSNWFIYDGTAQQADFANQGGDNARNYEAYKYHMWAPDGDIGTTHPNMNLKINPFLEWGTRSLLLQIKVQCVTGLDNQGKPNTTWRSLKEWHDNYNQQNICGVSFIVCGRGSVTGSTITYRNTKGANNNFCGIGILDKIDSITDYYRFNRRAYNDSICEFRPFQYLKANYYSSANITVVMFGIHRFDTMNIMAIVDTNTQSGWSVWAEVTCTDSHYETILKWAACFGLPFTDKEKYTFNADYLDDDLYLPIIDDNGITHGEYTKGADNANNEYLDLDSIRDKDYDPAEHKDPNTYSDTTNWNNVDFRQAFTKRYLLTSSQVAGLATELWAAQSSKPADIDYHNFAIDEYLTNNPIDTIVSLKYFPCTFSDVAPAVVHLGKYTTNIAATALGTSVRIIDFAPIECFPHFGDFRDYEPHTELAMYIPFCGTVKIPTAECMGNYVSVKLAIDTSTGAATGYVIVSKSGAGGICVATCQGMAAIDIPVSGLQSANLANAVFNATANWTQTQINNFSANSGMFRHMGGAMGAIARGMTNSIGLSDVKGGVLGGPIGAAGTLVNSLNPITALQRGLNIDLDNAKADYELSHIQVPTRLVGSASPALGCVIELDCRLIIYRPVTDENALSNYAETVGYATVQGGTVGQFNGFTVGTIDVSGINATAKEKQAIAAAFANGVYL